MYLIREELLNSEILVAIDAVWHRAPPTGRFLRTVAVLDLRGERQVTAPPCKRARVLRRDHGGVSASVVWLNSVRTRSEWPQSALRGDAPGV